MSGEQHKVGVMGGGFVGSALSLLRCPRIDVKIYDRIADRCDPAATALSDLADCDVIFIAVPTPMQPNGTCHTDIVRIAVGEARSVAPSAAIVVRSTVPPGTSAGLGCLFMPEFLTERFFRTDFAGTDTWIVGTDEIGDATPKFGKICAVLAAAAAHGRVGGAPVLRRATAEAEMAKYARNCFLASKVSFFNEFACVCEAAGISYEAVRTTLQSDARIGLGHTAVPGHDGLRGFGGTCFPKDTSALRAFGASVGARTPILDSVITRNETVDRPGRDWEANQIGRASYRERV